MDLVPHHQLAQQVHASGVRLVVAATGGGSGAIPALLTTPGASRSVLEALVPYSSQALNAFLGAAPEEYCSDWTARLMAMAAYLKGRTYDEQASICGVACTASLASDRPKRGPHRAHFAWQSATTTATAWLELEKGARDRPQEEALVAAVLLNQIADACGVDARVEVPLRASEKLATAQIVAPSEQQALLAGTRLLAQVRGAPQVITAAGCARSPSAVFPGAFNPMHAGHREMAAIAGRILNGPVAYEISIVNVDKPPLDFIEIDQRVRQFADTEIGWLSRAPTFVEKARLFPGATFVVGADTIERVGEARYYGGQESAMQAAITEIGSLGCRFLVFGRAIGGDFQSLSQLNLPKSLANLCREVPAASFRHDISSTELRQQQHAQQPH